MDFNYSNDIAYDFQTATSNFAESDSGCGSSVDDYPSCSNTAYADDHRFECIVEESMMECSEDELIIVEDEENANSIHDVTKISPDCHQINANEVQVNEPQLEPMDVAEELGRGFEDIQIDISGHQASRVIVSNLGAARHFCDLCGTEVEDLNNHFGECPAELELGPDVDRVFDAGEFIEYLMANEPQPEAPPIATRFIPGNHINNMEYILNCMSKERLRNN